MMDAFWHLQSMQYHSGKTWPSIVMVGLTPRSHFGLSYEVNMVILYIENDAIKQSDFTVIDNNR